MIEISEWIQNGAFLIVTLLCIKLVNGVVKRPECHRAQDSLKEWMEAKFDHLADLINGKKEKEEVE